MKLNEPGKAESSVSGSPVSRHSMSIYIPTYYRLRKREPMITLGSAYPTVGRLWGGGGGAGLNTLALRAVFYDTRSESSGKF